MRREDGITNLGRVPAGMTFEAATRAVADKRKYTINPYGGSHRLTICDTIRNMWRVVDGLPDGKEKELLRLYLGASFDYAKRMNNRMQQLKALEEC